MSNTNKTANTSKASGVSGLTVLLVLLIVAFMGVGYKVIQTIIATSIMLTSILCYAVDPTNIYPKVKIETSMGVIIVELDRVKAPITVNNFLEYVVKGEYNNTIFHRIIDDFIVQGGAYDAKFTAKKVGKNIINESGNGLKNDVGTIAMAKESRPHTANRQFFFNVADNNSLNPGRKWGYAVFGEIIEVAIIV